MEVRIRFVYEASQIKAFFETEEIPVTNEAESEKLLPILQNLGEWFQQKNALKFRDTSSQNIVGDRVGTLAGKQICGVLTFDTYNKGNEILTSY